MEVMRESEKVVGTMDRRSWWDQKMVGVGISKRQEIVVRVMEEVQSKV